MEGTDVFDSNVWILALTESSAEAETLLDEVLGDDRRVAVSAYVFVEVLEAFARELDLGERIDAYQTAFAAIVADSPSIDGPTQERVERTDLDTVRSSAETKFMARILSIQAKDVRIVLLAWDHYDDSPTVFTADRSVAEFDPEQHDLDRISLKRVDPDVCYHQRRV